MTKEKEIIDEFVGFFRDLFEGQSHSIDKEKLKTLSSPKFLKAKHLR